MSDFGANLYDAIKADVRLVALWWNERPIPYGHELKLNTLLEGLPSEPGLYAITGRHDAHAGGGVLYIGKGDRLDQRTLNPFVESSILSAPTAKTALFRPFSVHFRTVGGHS